MKYDGRDYRPNRYLGHRDARKGDVYCDGAMTHRVGEGIASNHVVVFRIKDAPMTVIRGQEYYVSSDVTPDKLLPVCAHTATNVALGPPKCKKVGKWKGVRMNFGRHNGEVLIGGQKYIEQAHYLVYDAKVYQWTSRRPAEQEDGI